MSKIKTHLEDLYELAEDALTTELAGTIKAHFRTDEEMYEWLDDEIFTDLRHVYQIVCDCRTDLPWNYVCLKSDKFIREVEKDYPELREDRRKDGFFLWDEADTAELYNLAADIVEFENDYDPYNGAFDSEEEAIASIMSLLTQSPETITTDYQERIEEEDEEDCNGYIKTMKHLIGRIGSRDWKYDGSIVTDCYDKVLLTEPVKDEPLEKVTTLPTLETLGKGDFRVDIVLNTITSTYYAWLYHRSYGIKDSMFGWPMIQTDGSFQPLSKMEELVEGNIDSYIALYKERYMDC